MDLFPLYFFDPTDIPHLRICVFSQGDTISERKPTLSCQLTLEHLARPLNMSSRQHVPQYAYCNYLLKGLKLILRMLELYVFSQVVSREFWTSYIFLIAKRTWSEETRASRGLAVSKGTRMIRDGEATGEGAQEAPGRYPQFRDCFSDDTLYTHGQQQPTHYGNDTCASIRINILMDTWEEVAGRRAGVSGTQTAAATRPACPCGWCRVAMEDAPERKQRDGA